MIKQVTYGFFVLVFIGCQSLDKPGKPAKLIDEDKMVAILTDIAFVKAAKSSYKRVFDTEKINPEAFILQKHGIDSLVFAENNAWYADQLENYEAMFIRVKDSLEKSKIKFERIKAEKDSLKRVHDSIRRINGDSIQEDLLSIELMDEEELFKEEEIKEEEINVGKISKDLLRKNKKNFPKKTLIDLKKKKGN